MHRNKDELSNFKLKVNHDYERQILEITSLIRVVNNYYFKKRYLNSKYNNSESSKFDFLEQKDSFRFPDSILLFESWISLGLDALYPRLALHYVFPAFLKGEKKRNLFQFTFSTSRGFGFPIYFGPEFYGYILKYGKVLEPLFKWCHTVCHRANQAIYLVENRFGIQRHHLGEFESAIISQYKNGIFKGIDTLLHGYFTSDPKTIGIYSSLKKALENLAFSYSVGDHAIKVETKIPCKIKYIPLINYNSIKVKYNIDFYPYVIQLFMFQNLLIKKILEYKEQRKNLINSLNWFEKIKLKIDESKNFSLQSLRSSNKFIKIENCGKYIKLMEGLMKLIWITPLFCHTSHILTEYEINILNLKKINHANRTSKEEIDSVFLFYIDYEEQRNNFYFEECAVIDKVNYLRDIIGKMWLNFKSNHFNYAMLKLKELSSFSWRDKDFKNKTNNYIDNLIPIFSIYEIFNRPLSETVYPEATPQRKRVGKYIARFLASKYNLFGVNLMRHFNNLAFNNWSYFIKKKKINLIDFFEFILKLPIWKYIPLDVKRRIIRILKNNNI